MSPADYLISIRSATEDYSKTDLLFTYTILKERYARLQIPRLRVLTQATVDGVMWYTVECSPAVAKELRQTGAESFAGKFYEHTSTVTDKFDISEDFYVFARVKWSDE